MDLSRENFRAMIFYDYKCGLTPKLCIDRLQQAFKDEAPSKTSVYRWFTEFESGRTYLSDDFREGRPATAITDENIDLVRNMINADRHVTYAEIAASIGIGKSQIQKILHEHLLSRKLCCRWIPHKLTDDQKKARVKWCRDTLKKYDNGTSAAVYNIVTGDESWIYCYDPETKQQSTVWVFQNENLPTKVIRGRSVGKRMVASFFRKNGHVATVPLEDRKTVNSDWYTTICLPKVFEELRVTSRKRKIVLHHDNASSHTSALTRAYLENEKIDLMDHPPYSPDLAPCDFYLFPNVKKKLRGKRFSSAEVAVEAYEKEVAQIPTSEWNQCFSKWFLRMKKCIDCNGDYFEKQ